MAIPKIKKQDITAALQYIDVHGVPVQHQSTRYELITEDGKRFPPKYVITVAAHLANGAEIAADTFHAAEAKAFLQREGFQIEEKQQKYELMISADQISSTDERFTMDDLGLGDHYKPLDTYFEKVDGTVIRRRYGRGERRNTNQTMPRIACQIFEKQLAALSVEEKEAFPICQYKPDNPVIRGIYSSVNAYRKYRNTIEYLTYGYDNGRQFVLYCWNIFSTLLFVQECLKRFGEPGDRFVLVYRDKNERERKKQRVTQMLLQIRRHSTSKMRQTHILPCCAPQRTLFSEGRRAPAKPIWRGKSQRILSATDIMIGMRICRMS